MSNRNAPKRKPRKSEPISKETLIKEFLDSDFARGYFPRLSEDLANLSRAIEGLRKMHTEDIMSVNRELWAIREWLGVERDEKETDGKNNPFVFKEEGKIKELYYKKRQ